MDIRFDGKRALVTGAGKGTYNAVVCERETDDMESVFT